MKTLVPLILLGILIDDSECMIHTLRYFDTSSCEVPNFPEFVAVGVVDDLQVNYFDSRTKKFVPKQQWMNKVTEEDPQYWDRYTQFLLNREQVKKGNLDREKRRLNQTEGAHLWQFMYGCDWDEETDEVTGYRQFAFDGEDFISLDLSTESWVAAKPQAFSTKLYWERIGATERAKHYIHQICAVWLKKFVHYGEETLKKSVLPEVSLLQRSPSSPVTCFATGFYPNRAMLFWTKDGEELGDTGEILPNGDGTFQSSVSVDLSSVPAEDWDRFSCVFQLSGVNDTVTRLDRDKIRSNSKNLLIPIASAVVVLGAAVVIISAVVLLIKKRRAQKDRSEDSQADSQQQQLKTEDTNTGASSSSSQDDQELQKLNPEVKEATDGE